MIHYVTVTLVFLSMNALAKELALLQVVLYEPLDNGDYTSRSYELEAHFSPAGAKISAEGDIAQMHPLGLCNNSDDDKLFDYGWVGVVKLDSPLLEPRPCLTVFGKAKRAILRGATAVIFDITDDPSAAEQLNKLGAEKPLDRPIIIIRGESAFTLMNIVSKQRVARARIQYTVPSLSSQRRNSNEYFNMGIFMAFFVLISIICLLLLLKIKWKQRRKQTSLTRLAEYAVSKMETRKFRKSELRMSGSLSNYSRESWSINSDSYICAICLEQFKDGDELRVVSCSHEFHRHCVDPWLIKNRTCPLCLHNIIEYPSTASALSANEAGSQHSGGSHRRSFFNLRLPRRQQSSSRSMSSANAIQGTNIVCASRNNNETNVRDQDFIRRHPLNLNNDRTASACCRNDLPNRNWNYCPHVISANHRQCHTRSYYDHHGNWLRHQQEPMVIDEYQHRIVPVIVQVRKPTDACSSGYDASVSNNMDASSSSSSLSAPWCEETTTTDPGSNQSVYGSSSTFRSDPHSVDALVYSRRTSDPEGRYISNSMENLSAARLTPTCMLRNNKPYVSAKIKENNGMTASHSTDSITNCEKKPCELPSNLNLRHTFTSTGQCMACTQLLRLPDSIHIKQEQLGAKRKKEECHKESRNVTKVKKGTRKSSQVRNHSTSSKGRVRCQTSRNNCYSGSRPTSLMQSLVLYTNQDGQVLTVPGHSDQLRHLEDMI
ncbi:uncharacterized protein LOC100376149 [Saccoglossus kowalevskii]|uniref:RING-type E3 ubiquitin transferase n=1 Tax=Saccoglossus kowalevskii TaxID=10224 RepID=A0ABM0GIZ4_SACKO|nr:PREDICTED: E3 ubiquitin-protein ligase ZNRF3-like [Saccoglossus kowalevskii]